MRRIAFLIILVCLLFACTINQTTYRQKLEQFVGKPLSTLEQNFGKPTMQKNISNKEKIITYIKRKDWYVPVEYYYDQVGWGADDIIYDPFFADFDMTPYAQIIDTEEQGICHTSFIVVEGIVQSYKFYGKGCF